MREWLRRSSLISAALGLAQTFGQEEQILRSLDDDAPREETKQAPCDAEWGRTLDCSPIEEGNENVALRIMMRSFKAKEI